MKENGKMKEKGTLRLDNPIKINGKMYEELTYNVREITAAQFSEAAAASAAMDKTKPTTFQLMQNDRSLCMYLGFMAVIAVNPEISIEDMERIKGNDIFYFTNLGLLFMCGSLVDDSQENNSEEPSENTADSSIPT